MQNVALLSANQPSLTSLETLHLCELSSLTLGCEQARLDCACADCRNGTFKNSSGNTPCSPCPAGTSSPAGSDDISACFALPFCSSMLNAAGGSSSYHKCAIIDHYGRIKCWGRNSYGALGYGDTLNPKP